MVKLTSSNHLRIINIPAGTTYSIVESATETAQLSNISIVVRLNDNDPRTTVNGTNLEARSASGTVVPNRENNIIFTNIIKKIFLRVYKIDADKITIDQMTGKVDITKGSLTGASFDLYEYDEENSELGDKIGSVTVGSDGFADLGYLAEGKYALLETDAPDGYNKLTGNILVTVDPPNATYSLDGTQIDDSGAGLIVEENGNIIFVIPNTSGSALPHTGSSHTLLYTAFGLTMLLSVGAVLHHRRKASEEE